MTSSQPDLFSSGGFSQKSLKEQVTPHKISLVVLIQEYCQLKEDELSQQESLSFTSEKPGMNITEREKRNFMVTILQLLQAAEPPLRELCIKIKDSLKMELYTNFLKRLQEFIDEGVGAVKDYFQNIVFLLMSDVNGRQMITKTSVLGLFIRRMILAFEKLTFSQVTELHTKFQHYYEAANVQNNFEDSQEFGGSLLDSAMSLSGVRFSKSGLGRSFDPFQSIAEGKVSEATGGFNSRKQAEYFILQQVSLLQHNENEALSPAELQDKIMSMLQASPDMAEAHFLSYLNSLRVKEYCTAFHNLFHYFDRNIPLTTDTGQQETSQKKQNKEKAVCRRYASLNLAALHFRFGHKNESMAALREAMSLAQEANDHVCLQHALGWLHRLGDQGTARTENLLDRAVAKSSELSLPNLTSIGIQAFARHNAFATAPPAKVFEYMQKSDVINCQHSQSGFMCCSYANKAALWNMYGKREMSSMMSQLILNLDTSDNGVYYNGESVCIALCNIAKLHAENGQYSIALDLINNAKKRFPQHTQHAHIWMSCEQEILFDRTVLNRKLGIAEQSVLNLKALNRLEAELRSAILAKEKGEVTEALSVLHQLVDDVNKDSSEEITPDFNCRLLLTLGELYSQTGNPTTATTYILECITLCKRHHLQYIEALAMIQLAYIQFQMQSSDQALYLLNQNMLTVLSHGGLCEHAKSLYCHVRCQVAMATKTGEQDRKTVLLSCVNQMNTVIDLFKTVEAFLRVKDALYYQARLYQELGYKQERNKCAYQFKQLDSQYPTLSGLTVNVL